MENISKRIYALEQSMDEIKDALKTLSNKTLSAETSISNINKTKMIDGIKVPAEIYTDINEIVDYIDFDRVITTMNALDWTLCSCDGPLTKEFLRKLVIELCVDCYNRFLEADGLDYEGYLVATAGWYVKCSKYANGKININVSFRVEDVDSNELLD